jgi:hypothetical protein
LSIGEVRVFDRRWVESGRVTTGDYLSVTPRAFGMAEVRLFCRCGIKSGARVKTGDLGAPVDLIAQALIIAEVQIFHQCYVESNRMKISD